MRASGGWTVSAMLLALAAWAAAQGAPATPQAPAAPATPGELRAASMTYDAARRVVLLFGGASPAEPEHSTMHGSLWARDGGAWKLLADDGPPARVHGCFTFDAKRQRAVLYGGSAGDFPSEQFFDDTWEWDGKSWAQVSDRGPGKRAHCTCAWDPTRERVLLFGGMDMEHGKELRDLWQWDGKQWQPIEAQPPAVGYAPTLLFDDASKSMLLLCVNPDTTRVVTAVLNGKEFVASGKDGPTLIPGAVVALGKKRGLLAFGGYDGQAMCNQTWRFADSAWTRLEGTGPSPRGGVAMACDTARDRVVLYGGEDGKSVFGDTWEFDGKTWSEVAK